MTTAPQKAAHMLAAIADLLDQGQLVHRLSVAVTIVAAAVLLVPVFPASTAFIPTAIAAVVVGLAELGLALRVGLDAAMFRRLAADAAADRLDVPAFDNAMVAIRILPGRRESLPIPRRVVNAKRVLMLQAAALFLQILIALAGGFGMFMEWF